MEPHVTVKTVLKRGALVAAANWQVTAIQFVAESTFKMLLTIPVVGGLLLVALVLGHALPELIGGELRTSLGYIASALRSEPLALMAFLASFAIVGLAGSVFMFLVKGGTVAVLAAGERDGGTVEQPPLHLRAFWTAAAFSLDRFQKGCRYLLRRYLRLGLLLVAVYGVSTGAYLGGLFVAYRSVGDSSLEWTMWAGIASAALVAWITLVNFLYLLIQMVIAVDDCSVRSAARRVVRFLRSESRLVFGVFLVVLVLVMGATVVSVIATTSLGLIAFVPLAGLTVIPLQLLAWLFRGLVFQYLGLSALAAYLNLYRRTLAPAGEALSGGNCLPGRSEATRQTVTAG